MIPAGLVSFLLLTTHTNNSTAETKATIVSSKKEFGYGTSCIRLVVPSTNNMLKTLLPTIFPIAISACPFLAAVIDVISSGSEVPKATIVRPIILSLTPKAPAIYVAPSTVMLLPKIIAAIPPTIKSNIIHIGLSLISSSSAFSICFAW